MPLDDVLRARLGGIERGFQVRQQLGEDRHEPHAAVRMLLCLGRMNGETLRRPVHVAPTKPKHFARTTQAAVASQGEHKSPFCIRAGFEHLSGRLWRYKVFSRIVPQNRRGLVCKRIAVD
ncbi:hypothetical protein OAS39_00685 [Pirellulales bacterium]|nr:hypothetical protein [Pirellulales bacterium]